MTIESDVRLNATKFADSNVSEDTKKGHELAIELTEKEPKWDEIGIEKYRQMRETGGSIMPAPKYLPEAKDETIPSREPGRTIPIRVYRPDNGQSKGVFMHLHGGGYMLSPHRYSDSTLRRFANTCQLISISVGYRLAPEHPFPAPLEDCYDAASYLVDYGEERYGARLLFIGGNSAGAHGSAMSCFYLMHERPQHRLAGLVLTGGYFDLALCLPQNSSFTKPLVLNTEAMKLMNDALLPGKDSAQRRDPAVSPLYVDTRALAASSPYKTLPPAIFTVGTDDMFLDDTVFMSCKWMMTGSEAIVRIHSGAPHGFTGFRDMKEAEEANAVIFQFLNEKSATVL